jgi:S-adenosyl-L-methionine hydrolase (adenosine-forming)
MPRPLITLTTDFGPASPYVAQMKGVILSLCREVDIFDITHGIKAQNIREGAVVLADTCPRFPAGTIHVAIVDPGVGTSRRVVYAQIGAQRFLAPDNGLLSLLASQESPRGIVSLENPQYWLPHPAATFHGRDVVAPVAAHLAMGIEPSDLGPVHDELVTIDWPQPKKAGRSVTGEVLYVDSFGNLITNIHAPDAVPLGNATSFRIELGGRTIRGVIRTYGAALAGELVALFDSQGRLEIAIVEGNAARDLQVQAGEPVVVHAK